MVSITTDTRNLPEAQRLIEYMVERANHLGPLNLAIAQTMLESTKDRFDEQQAPDGTPWVPSKAAKAAKRKTLLDTHHMRDNTFSAEATDKEARWGTNAVQARLFQTGGTIKMPSRKGNVRLRENADGTLMRQSRNKNLARFARANHKRARSVAFESGAYNIQVIARPFLGLSKRDQSTIYDLTEDYLAPGGA
ncbi:phage virion morphogenesis protein [Asticcacaulis sp. YBE204]|uniref:phage virion morphogenesis protein n=1 Tax=Asticcacaulis sp. YBE204 TaxID=1282363 RepID=UPI0003C40917|nr:phage virion morphogenesis protein [Asticcacaulis sp. YBE204]ESQ78510.1 hypothetical protein AEYBE204_13240 [Asticcacaulis sp. YBE204]